MKINCLWFFLPSSQRPEQVQRSSQSPPWCSDDTRENSWRRSSRCKYRFIYPSLLEVSLSKRGDIPLVIQTRASIDLLKTSHQPRLLLFFFERGFVSISSSDFFKTKYRRIQVFDIIISTSHWITLNISVKTTAEILSKIVPRKLSSYQLENLLHGRF